MRPLCSRILILALALVAVTAALGPAQAARRRRPAPAEAIGGAIGWSQLEGKPTIAPGRGIGYFIFREENVVTIITTNLGNKGRPFQASVISEGGTLLGARPLKLERMQDAFNQPSPDRINFHFTTYGATDGVQFAVKGGERLRIRLNLGKLRPEDCVFLGGAPTAAVGNPVIVQMGA
jgi:hypothetical protein